jgi:hypothetical protein
MVIEACRAMLTERFRLMCKQRGRQHRWFSHPTPASLEGPVRSCGPIGGSMGTLGFAFLAALASNADLHAEWVWWVIVSAPGVLLAATWPEARSKPKADGSQLPATYQPRELTSPGPSAP